MENIKMLDLSCCDIHDFKITLSTDKKTASKLLKLLTNNFRLDSEITHTKTMAEMQKLDENNYAEYCECLFCKAVKINDDDFECPHCKQ